MSSLKSLRQRFTKSDRDDRIKDTRDGNRNSQLHLQPEEDIFEVIEPSYDMNYGAMMQMAAEDTQSCTSFPSEELMSTLKWQSPEERKIFEDQLNQLQEQLMMVMIENQTLKSELNSSKIKAELEQTKIDLAYERHRSEILEKKLEQEIQKRAQKVNQSPSDASKSKLATASGSGGSGASSSGIGIEGEDNGEPLPIEVTKPLKKRLYQRMVDWFLNSFYTFLDDFTEEPPATNVGDPEGEPLTVKTLKENIKRFGLEAKPYVNTVKGIYDLLAWKSPPYTLIVFIVYMYSLWQGWFLPMLLFCLSFRLFISYLRHRGWNVNFNFFEMVEETKDTEEKDLGVSDKFNLVMQVARKVQNVLGMVADSLEKIKSLLTWRHPEASRQLFLAISAAFITSCIMPTALLFFYAGLYMGIKLFIIDYAYNRFPRVRRKYDSTYRLWMELPTDVEYEKINAKSEIDKYILPHSQEKGDVTAEARSDQLTLDDRAFCELFALPESECPLPGWQGGRRCTLINREKSLTAAFKNGRLYLTHRLILVPGNAKCYGNFLCFERTKVPSPKNIVIPLADIARLEKAKPYSWMPGGGMAIEIAVVGNEKSFIFGLLANRDDVFDMICVQGYRRIQEVCLDDDDSLPWLQNQTHNRKNNSPKRFHQFTLASAYEGKK